MRKAAVGVVLVSVLLLMLGQPAFSSSASGGLRSTGTRHWSRPTVAPAHYAGHGGGESVRIFPRSPTSVGNCIPFGNNTDYGFTGFIYRGVPAFTVNPGDRMGFDLGALNDVNVQRNIYFSVANKNPHRAVVENGDVVSQHVKAVQWVKVVSDSQIPVNPLGNSTVGDYELRYTVEASFSFPGGGFIVGFGSSPPGQYADQGCEQVLVSTTSDDVSRKFYARFCFKDDLDMGVLDRAENCTGTAGALGGIAIKLLGIAFMPKV